MICPKCGAEIEDDSIICPLCGDEAYVNEDQENVEPITAIAKKEESTFCTEEKRKPNTHKASKGQYVIWIIVLLFVGYKVAGKMNLDIGKMLVGPENTYDFFLQELRDEIDDLRCADEPDIDRLREDYEMLLLCLINEYMFKSMAYGHFAEGYDSEKFGAIADECGKIKEEMAPYYDEEGLQMLYSLYAKTAYRSFDDSNFNYEDDAFEHSYPDIDGMWIEYLEKMVKA